MACLKIGYEHLYCQNRAPTTEACKCACAGVLRTLSLIDVVLFSQTLEARINEMDLGASRHSDIMLAMLALRTGTRNR